MSCSKTMSFSCHTHTQTHTRARATDPLRARCVPGQGASAFEWVCVMSEGASCYLHNIWSCDPNRALSIPASLRSCHPLLWDKEGGLLTRPDWYIAVNELIHESANQGRRANTKTQCHTGISYTHGRHWEKSTNKCSPLFSDSSIWPRCLVRC